MNSTVRKPSPKSWLIAALLAAVMLRALIPAGFMPGPAGLTLCSGFGVMNGAGGARQSAPPAGGHQQNGDDTGACPFAAAAGTLAPPPAALSFFAAVQVFTHHVGELRPQLQRTLFALAKLPRGPPAAP